MNKTEYFYFWRQGVLLNTRYIRKFSHEEYIKSNSIEKCMIFKHFSSRDEGRSRIFISKSKTPLQAYDKIKIHNRIVTCLWKINKLLKKHNE